MIRLTTAILVIVLTTACSSLPSIDDVTNQLDRDHWEKMLGFWYAEIPLDDGSVRRDLVHRGGDGIMTIDSELVGPDGTRTRSGEILRWGVSGDIYITELVGRLQDGEARPVRGYHASYHIAYQIRSVGSDEFVYQMVTGGPVFTLKRIDPVFDISDIPLGSE